MNSWKLCRAFFFISGRDVYYYHNTGYNLQSEHMNQTRGNRLQRQLLDIKPLIVLLSLQRTNFKDSGKIGKTNTSIGKKSERSLVSPLNLI